MAWSRSSPNPCSTYSVVLIGVVTCLVRTVAATDISSIIAGEISALAPALADAQAPSAVLTGMERDGELSTTQAFALLLTFQSLFSMSSPKEG